MTSFVIMTDLISSLQFGIPSAIIVLIFLIVNKIIDYKQEINKDRKQITINKEIIDCFNNLNSFLKHITKDLIEKENDKCSFAIRTSFKALGYALIRFSTFTIINNNIQSNKKTIEDNINTIVEQEFSNLYNSLLLYYSETNNLVDYLQIKWKEELKTDLKDIIFDTTIDEEIKFYNINNKIGIRIGNYYSYINNKFLEND